jgi:hypothetical protein
MKYEIPVQILTPTKLKTKMYVHVDGLNRSGTTEIYWGANICSITNEPPDPNNPSKNRKFITRIDLDNANRKNISSPFEIGGDKLQDNKEIYLIVSNLEGIETPSGYKYSSVIIPVFQESYTPNPKNGTTKTVKNFDEDNLYKAGDTIRIEIDLSGQDDLKGEYSIEPDFSQTDSNYDKNRINISGGGADHIYQISYQLSEDNTVEGENIPIPIKAYDLTKQDFNEDTSFKVDIGVPIVKEVIVIASKSGITYHARWEKKGEIYELKVLYRRNEPIDCEVLTIRLIFSKPMDTKRNPDVKVLCGGGGVLYGNINPHWVSTTTYVVSTEKIPKNDRAYDCWANLEVSNASLNLAKILLC